MDVSQGKNISISFNEISLKKLNEEIKQEMEDSMCYLYNFGCLKCDNLILI